MPVWSSTIPWPDAWNVRRRPSSTGLNTPVAPTAFESAIVALSSGESVPASQKTTSGRHDVSGPPGHLLANTVASSGHRRPCASGDCSSTGLGVASYRAC